MRSESKAVDDYTFEVTLKVADPTFQSKLVATPLLPDPVRMSQRQPETSGEKTGQNVVYNGPFAMTNLVEDNSMTWVKNDQYWDKDNVKTESGKLVLCSRERNSSNHVR